MELRHLFTRDILADHTLTAVYAYCLLEIQQEPSTIRFNNQFIELDPYDVIIDLKRMECDLHITTEVFLDNVSSLEKLRRCTLIESEYYARIKFTNITFPIDPVGAKIEQEEKIAHITFAKWREIDLREVERTWSAKYLELVGIVLKEFGGIVDEKLLSKIGTGDYQKYVGQMREREISPVSINNYTRALKASFNRALASGYLKENPFDGMKPFPQERKLAIIIEREEFKLFREYVHPLWMRPIFDFLILTALRRNEALNLQWIDINEEQKRIYIHANGNYHPKFGKEREIYLSKHTKTLLDEILKTQRDKGIESDYVFVDPYNGMQIRGDRVTKAFKKIVKDAGIREDLTLHSLRRTNATMLSHLNTDRNTIKGVLGHASTQTTDRYIGVFNEDMAKALDQVSLQIFLPDEQ